MDAVLIESRESGDAGMRQNGLKLMEAGMLECENAKMRKRDKTACSRRKR
jgi:hypothetical protein